MYFETVINTRHQHILSEIKIIERTLNLEDCAIIIFHPAVWFKFSLSYLNYCYGHLS